MYFWCFGFWGELGFLNCNDVSMCNMCMCLARGGVGGEGGEWMRELGLGFTIPLGTGGVLDMCLCFGCCGVGGVCGEWVRGLDKGRERGGGCYVCVRCESGFSV